MLLKAPSRDFLGGPGVKNLHSNEGDMGLIPGQIINAGEGVEKREPSYTVGGNVN